MVAKNGRYSFKRRRKKKMANSRLAVMPSVRSRGVIMKKVRSLIETARVMMDRDLVKLLREARKDIKEGKTVPLSSLRK